MKLFGYGIFLDITTRTKYGIWVEPHYGVIKGYSTRLLSRDIVEAFPAKGHALTGLVMEVPDKQWKRIDRLEAGYKRITIHTTLGEKVQLYVSTRQ